MTHYSRAEWGAREPTGRTLLVRSEVDGIALHWPGIERPLGNPERVKSALRAWQADHMDNPEKRWSDIAYQVAIDQLGNVYRLRGLRYRSAANGGTDVNSRFGALLLVVAIGEKPSDALIRSTRRRIQAHRRIFPGSRLIVGHRDIRPAELGGTACPGDKIQALIDSHGFRP